MKHDPDLATDAPGVQPVLSGRAAKASHCTELLGTAPKPVDTGALADEFAAALASELRAPLAELMGGAKPVITAEAAKRIDASTCVDRQEPLSAHFLLGEEGGRHSLIASIGAHGALALCDRAFGGTGEVPDPLPSRLPMSADLTLDRLGKYLADAMTMALGVGGVSLRERGSSLAKLVPFGRIAECIKIDLSVGEQGREPWTISLLAEAGMLGAWLLDCTKKPDGGEASNGETNRIAARTSRPLFDIPLPVTAVLGMCQLPLQRVTRLQAGDIIPLSLRREVPLMIGTVDIAGGTVGTVDDRVALQISRTCHQNLSNRGNTHE